MDHREFHVATSPANEVPAALLAKGTIRSARPVPRLIITIREDKLRASSRRLATKLGRMAPGAASDALRALQSQWTSSQQLRVLVNHLRGLRRKDHARLLKRAMDLIGAVMCGVLLFPLLAVIVGALWCEGGPILFRHRRIGHRGVPFDCLKFRTMLIDGDRVLKDALARNPELRKEWMRDRKLRRDPRITRLGAFLRRTSLDELPQIWNVIRGDMSLVGPRPVVKEELQRYGRYVRDYLSVTPGITGLWQVMGRNNTTYQRRVALDAYYARNQSLSLDAYVLVKTIRVVLTGHGAC
jgi:Undecaprenyl-phosphate galactose phosphotransferase WbaP